MTDLHLEVILRIGPPKDEVRSPEMREAAAPADVVEHMTAMIGEFKLMAEQAGYARLATILGLAHEEARQHKNVVGER